MCNHKGRNVKPERRRSVETIRRGLRDNRRLS